MQEAIAADRATKLLTENKAAQQMWSFYKANKLNLISRIRVHGSTFCPSLCRALRTTLHLRPTSDLPLPGPDRRPPFNVKPSAARDVTFILFAGWIVKDYRQYYWPAGCIF